MLAEKDEQVQAQEAQAQVQVQAQAGVRGELVGQEACPEPYKLA